MIKKIGLCIGLAWCVSSHAGDSLSGLIAQVTSLNSSLQQLLVSLQDTGAVSEIDASVAQMDALLAPVYTALGITPRAPFTGTIVSSTQVTSATVLQYQSLLEGSSQNSPTSPFYSYYRCGLLFLALLVTKDTFENAFSAAVNNGLELDSMEPEDLSPALIQATKEFIEAEKAFRLFNKDASGVLPLFPDAVIQGYALLRGYAEKIVTASVALPEVQPLAVDTFIQTHFTDTALTAMTPKQLEKKLKRYAKLFTASDPFAPEYQMWLSYAQTRYWELKVLTGVASARKAFMFSYLNGFLPAYQIYKKGGGRAPYLQQLGEIALEFSVTYSFIALSDAQAANRLSQ